MFSIFIFAIILLICFTKKRNTDDNLDSLVNERIQNRTEGTDIKKDIEKKREEALKRIEEETLKKYSELTDIKELQEECKKLYKENSKRNKEKRELEKMLEASRNVRDNLDKELEKAKEVIKEEQREKMSYYINNKELTKVILRIKVNDYIEQNKELFLGGGNIITLKKEVIINNNEELNKLIKDSYMIDCFKEICLNVLEEKGIYYRVVNGYWKEFTIQINNK